MTEGKTIAVTSVFNDILVAVGNSKKNLMRSAAATSSSTSATEKIVPHVMQRASDGAGLEDMLDPVNGGVVQPLTEARTFR